MGENLAAAAIISFVIGFLKKSSWFPWLSCETATLNRMVSVAASGLASIGIHGSFDHAAGRLIIEGLTLTTISVGLYHWLIQFLYTHGWFKATSASDQVLQMLKTVVAIQTGKVKVVPAGE